MSDSKKKPELYVLVGPNGSGKSTVTRRMGIDRRVRGLIVNPDLYIESLDIDDPVERWKRTCEDTESIRNQLLSLGETFAFETVGTRREKLEFLHRARNAGYRITVIFVTTNNPEINIRRVKKRVEMGGHDVPVEKIRSRYALSMSLIHEYIDIADEARVIDNSVRPVLVFSKCGEECRILRNPDVIPWVGKLLFSRYPHSERTLPDPEGLDFDDEYWNQRSLLENDSIN